MIPLPEHPTFCNSQSFGCAALKSESIRLVDYIRTDARNNLKSFQNRRRADPEAALAEAMVFGMLQQLQLKPTIEDEPGIGGADYLCTYWPIVFTDLGAWELIVEATTLEPTAVERNSGWRNEVPDGITGGPFSMITERITARASDKVRQLSKYKMPRVLAIVSSHIGANALLSSTLAAQNVLISDAKISQPIVGGLATQITDLKSSAFLRCNPATGKVISQRQSISAVLLVNVAGDRSSVLGILHPEPLYPLNVDAFPEIPFVKIQRWPVENGEIRTEWVLGQPSGRDFKHQMIRHPGDNVSRMLRSVREKRKRGSPTSG